MTALVLAIVATMVTMFGLLYGRIKLSLVGLAVAVLSLLLSGCGGNTTEAHPEPTCWPVVVIDSVEYCGGEG